MMKLRAVLVTAGIVAGGVAIGSAPASAAVPVMAVEALCGASGGTWATTDGYACIDVPVDGWPNRLVQAYRLFPGWDVDGITLACFEPSPNPCNIYVTRD